MRDNTVARSILSNLQRHRAFSFVFLCIAAGAISGYLCAAYTLFGLVLILASLGILVLLYIFFKGGKLRLSRAVIPLLVVAVLFPSIRLPAGIPAVRVELIIILTAWLLFLLGDISTGKEIRLRWNPTNKWFFLFGTCILVSIAYAAFVKDYYPIGHDFWEFGKLIEYFLIFALVASLDIPSEQMRKCYLASLIVFVCSAVFGFAQYFNLFDINSIISPYYAPTQIQGIVRAGRIVGTTGNPNEFGALMVLAASLALTGALWLKERGIKLASWIALGVFSLAIMFTLSRSALLGLLTASIFILFFKYLTHFGFRRTIRMFLWAVPLLLILTFVLLQLAPDTLFFRAGSALNLSTDTSWQARLLVWGNQLDVWKQSPIFGWGPGKETMTTIVDNEWLLLLRRYGVAGVLVFILWFTGVYRNLAKVAHESKKRYTETFCAGLEATLVAYAIYMIPAGVYHSLQLMPILLIFLGLAYSQGHFSKVAKQR